MTEIKGIIAAMQTPMFEDGSINEAEMRNQINREIEAGCDGIFCLGNERRILYLSFEEKVRDGNFVEEAKDVYRYMQVLAVPAQQKPLPFPKRHRRSEWMCYP